MMPERWQEVKKVLAGALERTPEQRSAYLDQSCSDATMRREVESLIAAHEQGDGSFMERPLAGSNEALKPGTKLGPYEILARIGAGGMGVVYRARDGRLERDVAIKVLPLGMLADDAARKRFRKEALALAKLNHPNIAAVYDVGEQEGTDYLVMECVPGKSLAEEAGPISRREKDAVTLGTQIAAALEDAHEQGVVHRDLKPGNIMVTPKRQVKVLDFGLAKILRVEGDSYATESFAQTDNLAGTLPYMAPEQLRGEPADARTDVHALGAVLFEIITGQRPYQEDSTPQLTDAILHRQPVTPRALNARVTPEMERIILKCLEKERENRYQSAKEIGVDLRRLSSSSDAAIAAAAAQPGSRRRVGLPLATALVVALALAAGGYLYFHRAPKLTEKDSIVVADFTNTTGDPVFDSALRQGISAQLQQTPFLRIVSDDQIGQTLRLMEKPPDARLTQDVAREVCQRVNATTAIEGSIAALGNQYVIGVNAVNCHTGEALVQEQATAEGKEKVLSALGSAASELRSKLGESHASLEKFDAPLDQVTTPSLEALQAWGLGTRAFLNGNAPSGLSFLQRAVDLDPNFAVAYSTLGIADGAMGDNGAAVENFKKGYALRERASEREKFSISTNYDAFVTGNNEKAAETAEQWTKLFPRDPPAYLPLEGAYLNEGRFDEALAAGLEGLRLDPAPFNYHTVAFFYLLLGRMDEARATIRQAEANQVDPSMFSDVLWGIAFVQNDSAEMAKQQAAMDTGGVDFADENRSFTVAYSGHLSESRELAHRAIASAKQHGATDVMDGFQLNAALLEALYGNFADAERDVKPAGNVPTSWDSAGEAGIVWALSGNAAEAQKRAADLEKRFPESSYVRFGYLPAIRALLAIHGGDVKEGVESVRAISSNELMMPTGTLPAMIPVYVSGETYLAAHQGAEAAAQFQMIVDHPGAVQNAPIGALAHLGLGRAYALEGDTPKARAAYQDFLSLWKDADPDIPVLKQAKAEYAKLK